MSVFESIDRSKVKGEVNPQTQAVYDRYARMPVDQLLKVVISIHRGEYVRD